MSDLSLQQQPIPHNHIPPKPPDKFNSTPINAPSYKETLLKEEFIINNNDNLITDKSTSQAMEIPQTEMDVTEPMKKATTLKQINLTAEDINRMYSPWKFSIIIKLISKRLVHHYLKKKLQDLWKINENLPLIDLGEDYYTVKLAKEENMIKILHNGPWFVNGFFLSTQKWVPNFVAKKACQSFTAIWVRLPQLPTEFYDGIILSRIGNSIGKLLKVDACTSATLRGRYARLCVELPLDQPVQNFILIGDCIRGK
ncbi:PREDICTED: uncharacterized protein LOC109230234 [Nicotiana attenuata]|uniref:uncharacterized protein LOC109230234 n=1 Tax=Nicotiana attenuata TaxID=49451 RepID=UPI000904AA3E|nr:PREDICTED: uncharacterized protein LOC109230234 [Nicotiana attenuata]